MSPTRLEADYGLEFVTLTVEREGERPVVVTLRDVASGLDRTVRSKYVVGCDGARSRVRDAIGAVPRGDFANHAWGVVDMLATTDFPDIRLRAAIQSADEGNILLIPREGGYLVRLYVDLGEIDPNDREAFRQKHTQESVIATAQRVLCPVTLDVKSVAWFAVYQVGQPVTDRFDDVPVDQIGSRLPRVFIAGDACHTHSAKAGQGMNVSMQDSFNLSWKLASVLEGRAKPELLRTYSAAKGAMVMLKARKNLQAIESQGGSWTSHDVPQRHEINKMVGRGQLKVLRRAALALDLPISASMSYPESYLQF